jgi:hypothetical protein
MLLFLFGTFSALRGFGEEQQRDNIAYGFVACENDTTLNKQKPEHIIQVSCYVIPDKVKP